MFSVSDVSAFDIGGSSWRGHGMTRSAGRTVGHGRGTGRSACRTLCSGRRTVKHGRRTNRSGPRTDGHGGRTGRSAGAKRHPKAGTQPAGPEAVQASRSVVICFACGWSRNTVYSRQTAESRPVGAPSLARQKRRMFDAVPSKARRSGHSENRNCQATGQAWFFQWLWRVMRGAAD